MGPSYPWRVPPTLASLDHEDLNAVVSHPLQSWALDTISGLLHDLRLCESPADYANYQKLLFQFVWQTENKRSAVRRTWKRVKRDLRPPSDAPRLQTGRDPADAASWRLEDLTLERVLRQLRCAGDALAWRVSGFDRRYVLALSRNASPGPMAGKVGLGWELAAVEDIWNERGHFALLHDLTSCLRIGDLTEFTRDGGRLLHEVKKGGRRTADQLRRMRAAVRAINDGEPLPGTSEQLVSVDTPYDTHLGLLADAVTLAKERGVIGLKVPGGRALIATDLSAVTTSTRFTNREEWIRFTERTRARVLRRAGISEHAHHLTMKSADWAARSPTAVPFGVYPLAPEQAAALICDFTIVESVLSGDTLFDAVRARGMRPQMLLPDSGGNLAPAQPMFRFARGDRAIVIHARATAQLLAELITLDAFLEGLSQLLVMDTIPPSPIVTFRSEARAWL